MSLTINTLQNLTLEETEELEEDINMYLSLEKSETNLDFWKVRVQFALYGRPLPQPSILQSMLLVCASALEELRTQRRLGFTQYAEQVRTAAGVKAEISTLLADKTYDQLLGLQSQVQRKLNSGDPIDVEYWENLLKELIVWKAKVRSSSFSLNGDA